MKYIDEFRDGEIAQKIAARLRDEVQPGRNYSFMEFCGGHTHAISRYGVMELLLMSAVAVQGARFAYALVTPASPVGEWRARLPAPS